MLCAYCHDPIKDPKPGQRFCRDKPCRQRWHRGQHRQGVVTGVRKLKSGQWSVTIRCPELPAVRPGSEVSLETGKIRRPDAS